jgi:alpha-1,3-rhamnosyl/mannosyltransferase
LGVDRRRSHRFVPEGGRVTALVAIDADVLGRNRTGEETYVLNLLRQLPIVAPDLRFAAITRTAGLVPEGVEALLLPARFQETRMAWSLPRLLRRACPQVAHFQHALPLRFAGPSVVTVHDLHFEHDPTVMGRLDRLTFKTVVPRAVRRADHVIAVSEATKRDVVDLYGIPADKVTVTPHGVDPAFAPGAGPRGGFVLFVGAIQARKDPLAAADAAAAVGLPLVVVGPEKEPALADELRARGADVRGWVAQSELARLYREADALVLPSRFEGFGVPVLEAMASGLPVVVSDDAALAEVAGPAGVYAADGDFAAALRRALAERARWAAAGLERAKLYSWEASARRTAEVYRRVLA